MSVPSDGTGRGPVIRHWVFLMGSAESIFICLSRMKMETDPVSDVFVINLHDGQCPEHYSSLLHYTIIRNLHSGFKKFMMVIVLWQRHLWHKLRVCCASVASLLCLYMLIPTDQAIGRGRPYSCCINWNVMWSFLSSWTNTLNKRVYVTEWLLSALSSAFMLTF